MTDARVVIVGAGIAGVAAAHALCVERGIRDVLVVDQASPMTGASAMSMECYRAWMPDDAMRPIMRRSVTLMKEAMGAPGHGIGKGYLIAAPTTESLAAMRAEVERTGARDGEVEVIAEGLSERYPEISKDVAGALFLKDAGWIDAQQFGLDLFDESMRNGATYVRSAVESIAVSDGCADGVVLSDGDPIRAPIVVNAAGTAAEALAATAGTRLELINVPSYKVAFRDHKDAIPRSSPVLVWGEPQRIDWDDAEAEALRDIGRDDLLGELGSFCHCRPEGGPESQHILAAWAYAPSASEETPDPLYAEVVIRGLSRMLPSLDEYRDALPGIEIDGATYTATASGHPVVGLTEIPGLYAMTGLGSAGIAASMGLAEVLATAVTRTPGPAYSSEVSPMRARMS